VDLTELGCFVVAPLTVVALVFGFLLFRFRSEEQARLARQAKLREGKDDYDASMKVLKRDPTNPDKREHALQWGRYYASLCRESGNATLFDELALKNDLDAATAAAARPQTVEERLRALDALKSKGLVTDQEYATQRARILQDA